MQVTDEGKVLDAAEAFEKYQGRFPLRVSHLHGYEGPRCDIISFGTENDYQETLQLKTLQLSYVVRFIEAKGRSGRTGAISLSENEYNGAQTYRHKYFVYRVFCDPIDDAHIEIATLKDPVNSPTFKIVRTAQLDLNEQSGAEWFRMTSEDIVEGNSKISTPET